MRMSKDARLNRFCLALFISAALVSASFGAEYRTPNFVVTAPSPEIAEKCGKAAEHYRKALAIEWLGEEMPRWFKPCTLRVKVGQIGAGGATTFAFDRGQVFGWRMNVQGSLERILDSVIPHEVSHTIFASHFRRPLPRWADEGAATLIEHESERRRQSMLLKQVWNTPGRIPLRKLLSIKEYPSDMRHVLTLYAEGYSLADFLVQAGGKTRYLEFLDTAHKHGWDRAIAEHYSLKDVDDLESRWNSWVMAGSPQLKLPEGSQIASNESREKSSSPNRGAEFERPLIRAQSPEPKESESEAEPRVASVSRTNETAQPKVPVELPLAAEVREESPGWRQLQEELQEIPADFVNPANDPTRISRARSAKTTETQTNAHDPALEFSQADPKTSPPSNPFPFRFELDEASHAPGGQAPGGGRTPEWSGFPRSPAVRDQTRLGRASNGPFSP